jgi:hypothetical protein
VWSCRHGRHSRIRPTRHHTMWSPSFLGPALPVCVGSQTIATRNKLTSKLSGALNADRNTPCGWMISSGVCSNWRCHQTPPKSAACSSTHAAAVQLGALFSALGPIDASIQLAHGLVCRLRCCGAIRPMFTVEHTGTPTPEAPPAVPEDINHTRYNSVAVYCSGLHISRGSTRFISTYTP